MSGLILCRTKEAKNPFYISNMDLNIYSLEELCYYIYNNIYVIGMDLADSRLIEFIREETGEVELADRIMHLKEQRASLAEIVVLILKYVDYYSIGEIEEIREILETLNTQNVYERLKSRADSFLGNKCFVSAIKNYDNIISGKRDNTLPSIFYARVYHNMGVAYAKLFLFEQAKFYFNEAYNLGQIEESKKCYIAASILQDNKDNSDKDRDDSDITELEYVMKREIETLMDNALYAEEYRELEILGNKKNDGLVGEYYQAIDEFIGKWKKQYSKYIS